MASDHQKAAGIIRHLKATNRGPDQADAHKGNPRAGAGDAGVDVFIRFQGVGVHLDQRRQAFTKKIEVLFRKGLASERSPQHPETFVEYKGAVVEVIHLIACSPGVVEPVHIQRRAIRFAHRVIPDGIINHQRPDPVNRGLHGALYGKSRALFVDFIGFTADEVQGEVKQGHYRED